MGKRIISQRRGRGTNTYRSPSHRFKGAIRHPSKDSIGTITEILHCAGHSAPLMRVSFVTGDTALVAAPYGTKVGDSVTIGSGSEVTRGNVLPLKDIPEGTLIHNIELRPGDGGKLVRSSGTFAKVVAKTDKVVRVVLPSKKEKKFIPNCRAAIGVIAGSGRTDKPFMKAGTRMFKMRARNKLYPKVCGISMNAVDHPFGSGCSHIKGRPTLAPRSAPPGRKVGKIAPRRTGRKK
ncbi:50S ribosomal protein L2 [Candidatus Woesearchaeota archaeon]|jgi:large subunit ribosomal protein L2|nr:50S ribosomal protein L2 [Candidatus Woesearchaeota archaeon]MBT5397339.1 50S ribosomal protein L2 [Candidatus Woesearchaeota archaeon]MBT6367816.1 50S ribosomal protein L2 [Candidatus Woesearchaeota archaeon]MBT7762739.1 50S ribosomal protein L2 [Candidatus Woesearchaeota archaeon]